MLLSVEDVRLFYGPVEAVHGVTFQAGDGVTAIIGNNGAGKSTILKAISGLLRVSSGRIKFNQEDITGKNPADILKLGIAQTPEGRMVFPQSTVYENLLGGAYIRRDKAGIHADLEKYYEIFPILKKRLKMKAGLLSGGEQQMLAIARSLMSRPKLLMLDEPSLGLAPVAVEDVYRIIADIKKAGTASFWSNRTPTGPCALRIKRMCWLRGTWSWKGPAPHWRRIRRCATHIWAYNTEHQNFETDKC